MRVARRIWSWLSSTAALRRLAAMMVRRGSRPQRQLCGAAIHDLSIVGRLLGEGCAGWGGAQRLRGGGLAAIELLDQAGEQAPEERVARIAADAAELAAVIDQHEDRREALAPHEAKVRRQRPTDIDTAQRRAP